MVGGFRFLGLLSLVQAETDIIKLELQGMEQGQTAIISKGFSFNWGAATDKGRVRDENEDTFLVESEVGLFLVSDGMGGHRGGALASQIVAQDLPVMIETSLHKLRSKSG
jgi:hypothetical protein